MTEYPFGWKSRTYVRLIWFWVAIKRLFKKNPCPKSNRNLNLLRRLPYLLQDHELEELIYWTVTEYKQRIKSDESLSEIYKKLAEMKKENLKEIEALKCQ